MGDEGHDGDTSVASNDGAIHVGWVNSLESSNKLIGTDNIQSGDSKDCLGVVDSGLLEHLGGNGDGGVDRVGDNSNHSVGTDLCSCSSNGSNNRCVCVEEIILVMPGLRGTPAGITTISAPTKLASS